MKTTATWLESRKEPRNQPEKRYDVTVDGREGLYGAHPPERRRELPASPYTWRQKGSDGAR
jgi:hypothetical protein